MAIAAFDIGGTAVKYGLWNGGGLSEKGSFPTPKTWEEMKQGIREAFHSFSSQVELTGAGFSFPGAVNSETGVIGSISAVPYIHHFPIKAELEQELGVPVHMENDANCAALAEVWQGAAAGVDSAVFVVIGTGIGGAVIADRQLIKGPNLFGGEFGFMLVDGKETLSKLGSPVQAVKRYARATGETLDGKELFERAAAGDAVATRELEVMKGALAIGIHNLLVSFNPEVVIVGGAISTRDDLLDDLTERVKELLQHSKASAVEFQLVPCAFRNDANLIGAVAPFESI